MILARSRNVDQWMSEPRGGCKFETTSGVPCVSVWAPPRPYPDIGHGVLMWQVIGLKPQPPSENGTQGMYGRVLPNWANNRSSASAIPRLLDEDLVRHGVAHKGYTVLHLIAISLPPQGRPSVVSYI